MSEGMTLICILPVETGFQDILGILKSVEEMYEGGAEIELAIEKNEKSPKGELLIYRK